MYQNRNTLLAALEAALVNPVIVCEFLKEATEDAKGIFDLTSDLMSREERNAKLGRLNDIRFFLVQLQVALMEKEGRL
jgi:hypothetical protein